jgi:methanogenic corrinoid protein MtbC1
MVEKFESDRLTRELRGEWERAGLMGFLTNCIAPLVKAVGDRWAGGGLTVRHEHFLSERVGDILGALRLPLDDRARGPVVVCATLPGEEHGLGLQMAALVLSDAGNRIVYLGTEVPAHEIASVAGDLSARVIAVSLSEASRRAPMRAQVRRLRRLLPARVTLLVGGAGAPKPRAGLQILTDLNELQDYGRRLAAS